MGGWWYRSSLPAEADESTGHTALFQTATEDVDPITCARLAKKHLQDEEGQW